jgi:hypothetical protein
MRFIRGLFVKTSLTPKSMKLEPEGLPPIHNPSENEVRSAVLSLAASRPSFISLTDEDGNYVQAAGSRPWCLVEFRVTKPTNHMRAYQHTPNPKYRDGAKIRTGVGDITLQHDEWFLLKDAAEIFVSFLNREPFPSRVMWRSQNEMFGL